MTEISDVEPVLDIPRMGHNGVPPLDGPLVVRPLKRAFQLLGIGKTHGHELIRDGHIEIVVLGKRARGATLRLTR